MASSRSCSVAICHDYLNQYGGAERVLEALLEIYPEADLYTLFYDPKRAGEQFKVFNPKTSFLNIRFIRRHHRIFIPLFPYRASKMIKAFFANLDASSHLANFRQHVAALLEQVIMITTRSALTSLELE